MAGSDGSRLGDSLIIAAIFLFTGGGAGLVLGFIEPLPEGVLIGVAALILIGIGSRIKPTGKNG